MYQVRQVFSKLAKILKEMVNTKRFDYGFAGIFFLLGISYALANLIGFTDSILMAIQVVLVSATYFLISYLFIIREEAKDTPNFGESIVSIVSMSTPMLIVSISTNFGAMYEFSNIGICIMSIGLLTSLLALYYLKKSFSIFPARRRIVTRGLYSVIRHPIYAGQIMMGMGLVLTHLNLIAVVILLIGIIATLFRINIEETKLSTDDEYKNYRLKVRHKLLPLVW